MKILALNFERAYSDGLQDDYSDEVERRFTEWFGYVFLGSKCIHYSDASELLFDELTEADNQRIKMYIEKYTEN